MVCGDTRAFSLQVEVKVSASANNEATRRSNLAPELNGGKIKHTGFTNLENMSFLFACIKGFVSA